MLGTDLSRRLAGAALALVAAGCRERGLFADRTADLGIDFRFQTGSAGAMYLPEITGGGVGLLDYDLDGDLDVYLANGNGAMPEVAHDAGNIDRLFRQEAGGRFTDVTAEAGVGDGWFSMGVAVGDIDNDADPDLFVSNLGPDTLYRNLGGGRFEDISARAGLDQDGWSMSAAFCDYDQDGLLDLYVTQYLDFDRDVRCQNVAGQPEYCGPRSYRPLSDKLYRNEGAGRFRDVSGAAGLTSVRAAGMGVVCRDLDEDGRPDFYVANDGYANDLWINQGDGTFRNQAIEKGVAFNLRGESEAGMGVLSADLDQDGRADLVVTNLRDETNTFYRGLGPGLGWVDETQRTGLGPPSLSYTGFGVVALDLELDGDLDLAIANGRVKGFDPLPDPELPAPWDRLAEPDLLFLNQGGASFAPVAPVDCGALCTHSEVTRGLASGDLDRDGDLDLVAGNMASPARVLLNQAPREGRWLAVMAFDDALGREATGARVRLTAAGRVLERVISRDGSYLSSSAPEAHFGVPRGAAVERLEVIWPGGAAEAFDAGCLDCRLELRRGKGRPLP